MLNDDVCTNNSSAIGLKIYANALNSNRNKAHGDDIIIGAGFDCASRCSWHKPRLYWVADSYKYRMDPITGNQNKHHYENNDLRISILWPRHLSGSITFYAHGFTSDMRPSSYNLDTVPMHMYYGHHHHRQLSLTTMSTSSSSSNGLHIPSLFPEYNNPMINYPLKISNLVDSSVLLSLIEKDLFTDGRQYISVAQHLDILSSVVLDRISQLMINCIKYTTVKNDVFSDYFITFLCLMGKKLGMESVLHGLCRLWIINPLMVKQENQCTFDFWSFLHLIVYYGKIDLMMCIMQVFPAFRAVLFFYLFVFSSVF